VVTGRSGTIGKVTYVEENFWAHNTSLWVTDFKGNHTKFVYYFYSRYKLEKFATGSGVPTLNRNDVHCQNEHFPSFPEQQKIASFFTAIDKKISQLKKKKELLEQYKNGVMQKIFSLEIRFRDENGQDFPKWEKKKLKDLAEIKYGKDQKQISCHDGMYPILGTGGEMGRTNDFLTDKPSVLIGRKGTIDKPRYMDTPFWTVDTLFYTNVLPNTIPKWLFYKFGTINWYLYNEASGVPSLSSSTIYSIPINLPSLAEQSKIATFLSAIDDKICHVQTQIEKAELWKKGLLQKMFV
jgi:type I restriction enzyme S subunit